MATVRGAIAAYLNTGVGTPIQDGGSPQDAAIPGLNAVYRGMPTFIDPSRWWQLPTELGSGTIGYLHLAKIDEDRIALPAVEGVKFVEYMVALVLIYRYIIPPGTQTPYVGDEWTEGYDATVEAVKAYIRADPNLGTAQATLWSGELGVIYGQYPDAIWQAGQAKGDLSMSADLPFRDEEGGEVLSFQILEFHATECITA
jgi:hypothetical protein